MTGQMLGLREAISVAAIGSLFSVLRLVFSPVRTLALIPERTAE
ncbi:MAG TPA: hypothetical protein VMW65_17605 [Chloroflexota bacterium]|nr:hypothetical protein [Chloroflexota bacterium]